jgi:predicted dehydrogenase
MIKLRVAMIGAGVMGKAYSLAIASLPMYVWPTTWVIERELVVELTPELAEEARVRYGFARAATDWRRAVEDPSIDAIIILTPPREHAEVALAAIANGKHIVCEKPLATSAADARLVYESAETAGIVHQVGLNFRLAPAVQMGLKLLREGAVGEVISYRGSWLTDQYLDESLPYSWRSERGGGALGDDAPHAIDFAHAFVGEITEVVATSGTVITERASAVDQTTSVVEVEDEVNLLMKFATGQNGTLEGSRVAAGRKVTWGFEINGMNGSLVYDWERKEELRYYDARDAPDRVGFRTILAGPSQPGGEHFWPVACFGTGYAETKALQLLQFGRAVFEDQPVDTSFSEGLRVAEVIEAATRAADTQSWQRVAHAGAAAA